MSTYITKAIIIHYIYIYIHYQVIIDIFSFQYHLIKEPTLDQLVEAQRVIISEQQELTRNVARSTPSITRLQKRLRIMERVFIALTNR